MSNRKYSKSKKAQAAEREVESKKTIPDLFKENRKLFTVIAAIIIAVILVSVSLEFNIFKDNATNSVSIPNPFPWGSFVKISDNNFGNQIHFYWISWYGCPIGAANSWGLYLAVQEHIPSISSDITLHTSDTTDSAPGEPGLLFNGDVSNGNYYFSAYYMYNEYHNATTAGIAIPGNQLVSVGLQEVNSTEPSFISSMIYTIQTQTPSQTSSTGAPIAPIGASGYHLVTTLIITGPNGAYYMQGPAFNLADLTTDPSVASNYLNSPAYESYVLSPNSVYSNMKNIGVITDYMGEINTIVGDVS